MTNHHPPTKPAEPPPTARQQRYLRQLALQRGVTFVVPRTRAEASRALRTVLACYEAMRAYADESVPLQP